MGSMTSLGGATPEPRARHPSPHKSTQLWVATPRMLWRPVAEAAPFPTEPHCVPVQETLHLSKVSPWDQWSAVGKE